MMRIVVFATPPGQQMGSAAVGSVEVVAVGLKSEKEIR